MLGFAVIVTLLALEVILRIAGVSYPNYGGKWRFYTWDEHTGQALRPGAEGEVFGEGVRAYAHVNSQGLRDREHATEKPLDTYRIAVLGDSFTEGFQIPIEKTYWSVMEQKLSGCDALRGKRIEPINFGVSGYGTAMELEMLRSRVWRYSPDLVILAFFTGHNLQDNSRALSHDPYRPYFVHEDGELVLDDSFRSVPDFRSRFGPRSMFVSWAIAHSRLLQVAAVAKNRWEGRNTEGLSPVDMGLDERIYKEPQDPVWKEAWSVTEDLLLTMRNEVAAKGAKFLIVTLSNGIQVDPDVPIRAGMVKHLGVADLFYPDDRIKMFGDRNGIPVLTLAPSFLTYAELHKTALHAAWGNHQGHWNEKGQYLAGELIARELCSDGLLENSPVHTASLTYRHDGTFH
jgi:hypothetical protein